MLIINTYNLLDIVRTLLLLLLLASISNKLLSIYFYTQKKYILYQNIKLYENFCLQFFSYQKSNDINLILKSHIKLYHYFLFLVIV